jgi:hypothetical protein
MLKRLQTKVIPLIFLFALCYSSAFAQNPPKVLCPATPSYAFFDSLCFIPSGVLTLPQGTVKGLFTTSDGYAYLPSNHMGWALGIAHAWNYTRNVLRTPNKLSMELWLAIATQETQLGCIPGSVWTPAANGSPTQGSASAIYNQDGCYQIENSGAWISAASELQQIYPTRFVKTDPRIYFNYTYERASISVAYEFVMKMVRARYKYGVDPYAIAVGASDPISYNKTLADFHNNQMASFRSGSISYLYTNSAALQTNGNWPDFGTLGDPTYVTKVGKTLSVLQNRTTYAEYPPGSTFGGNYNANIPWDTVLAYINTLKPFYQEYSAANWTTLTTKAQSKFVSISGSIATPVAFSAMGPVMDQIILALPKEDPTIPSLSNDGTNPNWDGINACWGNIVPVGHIGVPGGQTTVCLGTSYTLNGVVDGGESSDISFKWFRNGSSTPFATTRNVTEAPAIAGTYTYSFQTCNSYGCEPALCDITITVNNCGGCGMTVSATTVNTPCQNMKGGTINLTVSGSTNYTVKFTGPVSGSITSVAATATISNVPDGTYNIQVIDNVTPTCKAYTNTTVQFTTAQNAQLSATITSATQCADQLKATIVENPAPCLWTVNFYDPVYYDWSIPVYALIGANNVPGSYQANIQDPVTTWMYTGKSQFYASTGDPINIDLTLVPTPGAYQMRDAYFEIVNSSGTVVWNGTVPASSVTTNTTPQVINYHVTTYTATCPFTPASYTFTWSPALTGETHTTTTSTGTANITFATPTLYTVTAHNASNTQCYLTDTILLQPTCPGALPVEFVSFNASLMSNNEVKLDWTTAMEKNTAYFQMERSTDAIHFTALGTVPASGYSSSLQSYHYTDHYALRGITYYRIAEYDTDGSVMYTEVKSVEGLKKLDLSVYPNPSVSSFTVNLQGEGDEKVTLIIYDILGNEVERKTIGANSTTTIGENLIKGAYILNVSKPDETIVIQKLIKE